MDYLFSLFHLQIQIIIAIFFIFCFIEEKQWRKIIKIFYRMQTRVPRKRPLQQVWEVNRKWPLNSFRQRKRSEVIPHHLKIMSFCYFPIYQGVHFTLNDLHAKIWQYKCALLMILVFLNSVLASDNRNKRAFEFEIMTFNNINNMFYFFSFSEENSEVDVWDGWFSGGEYLNLLPSFIYSV